MNLSLIRLALLSLLIPAFASADTAGGFLKVKAAERQGPAYGEPPQAPPNLPRSALQRFGRAAVQADRHSADPISAEEWEKAVDAGIKAMIDALKKPHSSYLDAKELQEFADRMRQKGFSGIGAQVAKDDLGAKIDMIFPNSPAEKAGIQDEDIVVKIDGAVMKGKDLNEVVSKLRGPKGTRVAVTVKRGAQELTLTAVRGDIKQVDVFTKMAAPGVGYVYLSSFNEDADKRVIAAVDALRRRGARKLILDVRFNPGGSLKAVNELVSEFLKNGQTIVRWKRQGVLVEESYADGNGRFAAMPLAVLINEGSASASEILAGALQDHKRAAVIGARTFGKGSVQTILPVMSDSAVKMTTAKWYTPGDRSIQGQIDPEKNFEKYGTGGVAPDAGSEIALTDDEKKALYKSITRELHGRKATVARDAALEKAIELLK